MEESTTCCKEESIYWMKYWNFQSQINVFTFEKYTCETALNFNEIYIKKIIKIFRHKIVLTDINSKTSPDNFHFKKYFENHLNVNEFSLDTKFFEHAIKSIENIFIELEERRAFQLLKNNNETSNHLLIKQFKINALTCTYAALKRKDFLKIGL